MRLTLAVTIAAVLAGTTISAVAGDAPHERGAAKSVVDPPLPNDADAMARLQEATQRLRDAIQLMGQQPPGERRGAAIRRAQQALFDAQQAMIALPPELYTEEGAKAQPNDTEAMGRLQRAAQKLRESVQAMAQRPAGPQRTTAAREAREAILETQAAMIDLPPVRSQAGTSGAGGAPRGSTGSAGGPTPSHVIGKTFSEIDTDNDSFISRTEAEADAQARQNFQRLDRNDDQKLSRSEWEAGQAPAAGGATNRPGK